MNYVCSRTSSATMGGYQLLSSLVRAGTLGMELLFLASATLFPAMFYSSMLLWCLFAVTIVMVASMLDDSCCRVNALKRQFKNIYVVVAVPTVEQIESFNQSYFK